MKALVVILAAFVAAGLAIHRNQQQSTGSSSTAQRTDVDGIAPHIERAAAILEQLRELDDLQTSLELCAPRERAQALRLEWVNHNGSRHAAKVWMDGSASTGSLIEAAAEERELLRSALLEEISAAYSAGGVTKAVTNPTDGEELTVYAGK
ncbi:MAG: hypothetical protein IIY70_01725 [Oscillospiraceae bacterium]|nr:hypothetical protein [Oscillospiraceae bacterium]